ncbi:16S rRNA (uracil(1498)-N(3))-methyltransferase [soil metagenome]
MPPRLYIDQALRADSHLVLPPGAARHVQVLRLQPGAPLTLFDGAGGEWPALVTHMGRSDVSVQVGAHAEVDRELALRVTIALGMPANERMDGVVEKATELGVAAIQPLMCERSVLRLQGDRAAKKVAHWQGVAQAACEQSGRTRVPRIEPVRTLAEWLASLPADDLDASAGATERASDRGSRFVLSLRDAQPLAASLGAASAGGSLICLSGPEGGLADAEEALARRAGFVPLSLGPRVLRADTAPLALLAHLSLLALATA